MSSFVCFLFLCGVNSATSGLYDYSFVHGIAGRNRNLGSIAAPMPRVKNDNWPGIFRSIHQSNAVKNAVCPLEKHASRMHQKIEGRHFPGLFPFSRTRTPQPGISARSVIHQSCNSRFNEFVQLPSAICRVSKADCPSTF